MPQVEPTSVFNQFPDYPFNDLPLEVLTDFQDTSWHNDTCPSFRKGNVIVWVDWPDPREREDFEGHRFIVCRLDNDGCLTEEEPLLETDDWNAVLAFPV